MRLELLNSPPNAPRWARSEKGDLYIEHPDGDWHRVQSQTRQERREAGVNRTGEWIEDAEIWVPSP